MLLQMRNISKAFPGVQALKDVSVDLAEGEVHVILGENGAGKSTLIKILSGIYPSDQGTIILDEKEAEINSPEDAREMGINTIYQEFTLIPHLSVAENIFLGRPPGKWFLNSFMDWSKAYQASQEILDRMEVEINPRAKVIDLGIAERQIVEIAKALSSQARILVMDEPTAALGPQETKQLFKIIETLKREGVGIIYITHRLEEMQEIGERVSVLRDGEHMGTLPVAETSIDDLIQLMVGRRLDDKFPKVPITPGREVLRVKNLTRDKAFRDISFVLHEGEILGLFGLVGSGRSDLVRAIFGAVPADSGKVWLNEKPLHAKEPNKAIRGGVGYLSEDRQRDGLILKLAVRDNITLAGLNRFTSLGWLNLGLEHRTAGEYVEALGIVTPDIGRQTQYLSGGNQQKVVIAKWLCSESKVLLFDEPTRGVDVGAKVEIYNIMNNLVKEGAAILLVSSECPEVLGMADRIIVMREGEMVAEVNACDSCQEDLLACCFGRTKDVLIDSSQAS
jgi:ribose transport system ATP-binding protein